MKNQFKLTFILIVSVLFGLIITTFSSCDLLNLVASNGERAQKTSIKITIPYPARYVIERAGYEIVNTNNINNIRSGDLIIDNDNNKASVELFVPAGSYNVSGNLYKDWDNETGSCFDVSTSSKSITLEEGKASELVLDDPLSTGVATLEIEAHVDSLVTALSSFPGRKVDFVGVWLNNTDPNINDNYHFHTEAAVDGEPKIFRGSYNYVKPGTYNIDLVATNFGHPDWTDDNPWHRNLTAENIQQTFTVTAGTTVSKYISNLIYQIGTDFGSGFDKSPFFFEEWEGGSSQIYLDELHLEANSPNGGGGLGLNGFPFGDQSITTFKVKLGVKDVSYPHPMLHVNFMQTETDDDTRLSLMIDEDSVNFFSIINGEIAGSSNNTDIFNFRNPETQTIKVFIRKGVARLYVDPDPAPVITYTFDKRIPDVGSFSFECHQEVYIDNLIIENNVLGNLKLQ